MQSLCVPEMEKMKENLINICLFLYRISQNIKML